MKILKISIFVIVLLNILGCDEDRFTSVKNIDFPEHKSLLAVTSNITITSDSSTIPQAFVSHSLGIIDEREYSLINDATVELYKDGTLLYNLENLDNNGNYVGPVIQDFESGTYTMKVSAANYDPIEAVQTVPSEANVVNSTYEFDKVPYDFDSDLYDLLNIKIADPEDEENYYSFEVILEVKSQNGEIFDYPIGMESDDPLFEDSYYYPENAFEYVLPDISFNGKNYDIRLLQRTDWYRDNNEEVVGVRVLIYTLSKDSYTYEISRHLNYEAEDNPFAEPVLVHSNFEGGLGVFTINNVTSYRHEF